MQKQFRIFFLSKLNGSDFIKLECFIVYTREYTNLVLVYINPGLGNIPLNLNNKQLTLPAILQFDYSQVNTTFSEDEQCA